MRSRLTRRSSVARSASGDGCNFSCSSFASMKLSIGFRTQAALRTDGNGRALRRLERPVIPISGLAVILRDGPRQLLVNPLAQRGDILVRETRTPQRHLEIPGLLDGADQQAVCRAHPVAPQDRVCRL